MTPDEVRAMGEQLYGGHWQAKLAEALPVSARSVRHWLSGKHKVSPLVAARIKSLLKESD